MAIIIPSAINSEFESTLRSINNKEYNLADYYIWCTINQDNVVDSVIVATFEVAEKRSLKYNRDYILSLSPITYTLSDYPGTDGKVSHIWNAENRAFHEAQPHASWTLNQTTWDWDAPLPYPTDGLNYVWDEDAYQADNTTGWVNPFPIE